MDTAWVYINNGPGGVPQVVHSSRPATVTSAKPGEFVVSFAPSFHVLSCVATPGSQLFQELLPETPPLPSPWNHRQRFSSAFHATQLNTVITAAPGDQVGLAGHQVRVQLAGLDLSPLPRYQFSLVVFGAVS